MSVMVGIIGQSGTGKTTSLRTFSNDDVAIIEVSKSRLPFQSDLKVLSSNDYVTIAKWLPKIKQRSIVIDDAEFLMVDNLYGTSATGFKKFDEVGQNFTYLFRLLQSLDDDKIVYLLAHKEQGDDGREHFKTVGKQVDNVFVLEGRLDIVLKTVVQEGKYYFQTHNNGLDTVKTPLGMFEDDLIPNDLAAVDKRIREYWNMNGGENNGINENAD